MGYRAIIREIRIKNFRSIVEATIPLDNFNIFVGLNDCGKSNILEFFSEKVCVSLFTFALTKNDNIRLCRLC